MTAQNFGAGCASNGLLRATGSGSMLYPKAGSAREMRRAAERAAKKAAKRVAKEAAR